MYNEHTIMTYIQQLPLIEMIIYGLIILIFLLPLLHMLMFIVMMNYVGRYLKGLHGSRLRRRVLLLLVGIFFK